VPETPPPLASPCPQRSHKLLPGQRKQAGRGRRNDICSPTPPVNHQKSTPPINSTNSDRQLSDLPDCIDDAQVNFPPVPFSFFAFGCGSEVQLPLHRPWMPQAPLALPSWFFPSAVPLFALSLFEFPL